MKNGKCFEWIPGKIISDNQDNEEDLTTQYMIYSTIIMMKKNSEYVPYYSYKDDGSVGSWET